MYEKEIKLYMHDNGYEVFFDSKHPLSTTNGRVYYHRHLMSIHLGRWIKTEEHIHHIDDNKTNNSLNNIEIISNSEHGKEHALSKGWKLKKLKPCFICKKETNNAKYCSIPCRVQGSKFSDISKKDYEYLIWNNPYTKVGNLLGISDVGAKNRAKSLGCVLPPARFHNRSIKFKNAYIKDNMSHLLE